MAMSTRLGCIALLAGGACTEPSTWHEVEPDFEWQGSSVTIYGYDRHEQQACGEALVATDEYVESLVSAYGTDAAVHVDYRWFSQASWGALVPCGDFSACTYVGDVLARELMHGHELAHAVSWDASGVCMNPLEEGLAEYFAEARPRVFESLEFDKDIEDILVPDEANYHRLFGEDYTQAGHFVSFLLEDYGIEGVRDLCEIVPFEASLADWDAATRSVLGTPLADVLADYASYPVCQHHGYRARLTDCAGEPDVVVSPDEETVFSLRVGCDEPEAVGERDGMVTVVKRVHADVPGWYKVVVEESNDTPKDPTLDVKLVLEQCAPCSEEPYVDEVTERPPASFPSACTWVESPRECGYRQLAGTHAFIFFLPAELEREVTVRIVP